jgi:hypothetical protein
MLYIITFEQVCGRVEEPKCVKSGHQIFYNLERTLPGVVIQLYRPLISATSLTIWLIAFRRLIERIEFNLTGFLILIFHREDSSSTT